MPIKCPHCGNMVPTVQGKTDEWRYEEWIAPHKEGLFKGRCPGSLQTLRVWYEGEPVQEGGREGLSDQLKEAAHHNNTGIDLVRRKRFEEAIEEYDKAIELNPNDPRIHSNKGLALANLERFEEALAEFKKAIGLDPDDSTYHISKGITLTNLRRAEEALLEFDKATGLEPKNPVYHNDRGITLYYLKRFEEAIKEFEIAIGLDPHHPHYHYNRGLALADLNKFEEAINEYEIAIELDAKNIVYHNEKAKLLKVIEGANATTILEPRICNSCGKKIDTRTWLTARDPRGKLAYIYPGNVHGSLEMTEEKIIHYDCLHLTEHTAELTERRIELAELVIVKKDWARALSILDEIQDPLDQADWYTKGNMLRNLGRHEEAVKSFNEAIFLDTHYAKAWYRKGRRSLRCTSFTMQ